MKPQIDKEGVNGDPGALNEFQDRQRPSTETTERTSVDNLSGREGKNNYNPQSHKIKEESGFYKL